MSFILVLVVYAALMVGYGAIVSRRVRAASSFFVAGHGLGAGLIFSTMLAANIGAGSTVGVAGLGYRDGLSAWWWVGSAGIGSLVLAFSVGPRIYVIAKEHGLLTVGDYLERRFNRTVRGIVALLLWIGSLSILAGQLIAVAWILNVVAGTSKPIGCLIAGAVVTAYFTFGGLHTAARVNVIQLAVKLIGFFVALLFLLHVGDGYQSLRLDASAVVGPEKSSSYLSFFGDRTALYIATLAPSFIISPGLLQKLFGARSASSARAGTAWNALGLILYAIVPVLLGVIARTKFPGLTNHELALPALLAQALPFWLGALLLAAIFSAELSAADAALFMLSTSLSKDIFATFVRRNASDEDLVKFVRISAVLCGLIAAILAMALPTVIDALKIFYSLLTAALFLPLIAGLYTTRVTARAAIVTMIVSVAITFSVDLISHGAGIVGLPPTVLGVFGGVCAMLLVTAAEGIKQRSHGALDGL